MLRSPRQRSPQPSWPSGSTALHLEVGAALKRSGELAWEIGRLLTEAKKKHVPHGQWEAWVKANCTFGPDQALNYRRFATLDPERARDLTIRQGLEAVATSYLFGGSVEEPGEREATDRMLREKGRRYLAASAGAAVSWRVG